LASATAPPSRYGMPQQRWAGTATSTPFFSSTATAALPVAGSLNSTEQGVNDLPAGGRRVRAVVVAELALVAEGHDLLDVGGGELVDVAVDGGRVEAVEHHLEGRAQGQAAPAPRARVVDASQLLVELVELPEIGLPDVESHGRALALGAGRSRGVPPGAPGRQ